MTRTFLFSVIAFLLTVSGGMAQTDFNGNGETGFGGVLGAGNISIQDDGTDITITFNRGTDNFNDFLVIYLDTAPGGITSTAPVVDFEDSHRKALTTNNVTFGFPPGFTANRAIALNQEFGAVWDVTQSFSNLIFEASGLEFNDQRANNLASYTLTFNKASFGIDLSDAIEFKLVAYYLNPNGGDFSNGFVSNEGIGRGLPSSNIGGTEGTTSTFETYFTYPNNLQAGQAPSATSGIWDNNATWLNGNPPLETDAIQINHNVGLDVNASHNNIEITIGKSLSINSGQTLAMTGGISGAGSLIVNGNLQINAGGFSFIAPTYNSGSTLIFETDGPYNIDGSAALWVTGNTTGSGVPDNVFVTTTNPLNIFGTRDVPGNLTISAGASVVQGNNAFIIQGNLDNSGSYAFVNDGANLLTIEGNFNNLSGGVLSLSNSIGGDLHIRGNWTNDGTFNANNRAVFFDGNSPQTIENSQAAGIEIPFLFIQNNVTALSDLTVSDLLEFNVDNTLTLNGTLIYGQISSRLRIVGNTNFETNDAIFPATNGPVNFEINHSGTVTLHDSRVLSGDIDVSSGTLIIKEGTGLTAANLNNAGTVRLNSTSTAYSSLIVNATSGTGIINYNRFTNVIGTSAGGGNDLITPPLSGQRFDTFALANEGVLAASGTLRAFAPFDNTANPGVYNNFDTVNDAETILAAGIGYRAAAGDVLKFTGTANTADIGIPINSATGTFGEWNLIGNPYPSYLDIAVFLNHEVSSGTKNIDLLDNASGIYGYNGNATNRWEIITLANSSGELMAPGQGFFVASGSASATLQFTRGMRTTGSSDDFIQGRNASLIYLKLKAATSDKSYTTDFYFNDNSTLGLDPGYDAKTWGGYSSGFKLYSHLVEDNSGLPIGLQSLHSTDLTNTTIPLGVNTNAGEQLTFSIAESSLPTTVNIYLEDTATNTFALLNTGDYTMTPNNALNGVGRFYLRFGNTALSTTDSNLENLAIHTNKTNKTIVIAGQLLERTTANVYDLQGRLVLSHALDAKLQVNEVDVNSLGQGVYIVELRGNTQNKTLKIILN